MQISQVYDYWQFLLKNMIMGGYSRHYFRIQNGQWKIFHCCEENTGKNEKSYAMAEPIDLNVWDYYPKLWLAWIDLECVPTTVMGQN